MHEAEPIVAKVKPVGSSLRPAPLRVVVTRLGLRGGMDRVVELIAETFASRREEVDIRILLTRGEGAKWEIPFVFAGAMGYLVLGSAFQRFDIVHANLATYGSAWRKAILVEILSRLGMPVVLHLHGANFDEYYASSPPFVRRMIVRMFRRAACVVVIGQYWQDFVSRITDGRVRTCIIYNAVAPIPSSERDSDEEVLFAVLGAVGQRKGTDVLIDALAELSRKQGGWRCIVGGDGDVEEFRAKAKTAGLGDRIVFTDWLDNEAAKALVARSTIVVLPSRSENLPMSIIEGLAAGKPVITTPVGAIPEIVTDGVEGFLVPVGNAPTLANAMERMLIDPSLRRRMSEAARRRHRDLLDLDIFGASLLDVWMSAAGGVHEAGVDGTGASERGRP